MIPFFRSSSSVNFDKVDTVELGGICFRVEIFSDLVPPLLTDSLDKLDGLDCGLGICGSHSMSNYIHIR